MASCTLIFNGSLGPQPLKADFAGDAYYEPSSDTGKTRSCSPSRATVPLFSVTTPLPPRPRTVVTWWDSHWSDAIALSGGDSPSAFKGFAYLVVTLPTTTRIQLPGHVDDGRREQRAADERRALLHGRARHVKVTKLGSTISGNFVEIVVVITDPGYEPGPGHSGTGGIVATFCQ